MKRYLALIVILVFIGCAYGVADESEGGSPDASSDVADEPTLPDASLPHMDASVSYGGFDLGGTEPTPIQYHGGRVMTNPVHVYLIWYGNWQNRRTVPIIEDLITDIGSSDWFKINTTYYELPPSDAGTESGIIFHFDAGNVTTDGGVVLDSGTYDASDDAALDSGLPKTYVISQVSLAQEVFIGYTHGYTLVDNDIRDIVKEQITNNQLPSDENGIYFVLTDEYVSEVGGMGGFCTAYCGWHDYAKINGADIKYSFIGDTERCPADCSTKAEYISLGYNSSPNGDWSADGMFGITLRNNLQAEGVLN
jgi:hypothetical protein